MVLAYLCSTRRIKRRVGIRESPETYLNNNRRDALINAEVRPAGLGVLLGELTHDL